MAASAQLLSSYGPVSSGSDTDFVTGASVFSNSRNDATATVGFRFTIGAANITVTSVGRWVLSGNSLSHAVKIYNSSGTVLASGTVNTSGITAGTFAYASVTPVVLTSGVSYWILSQETGGGDSWYDNITGGVLSLTHTGVATIDGSSTGAGSGVGTSNNAYGFPGFRYH